MTYVERIEKAVSFIELNLHQKITTDLTASEACFSLYHFHRIFTAMVGETPGDYIRKRRLTKASEDLIRTNKSILEIAVTYQFDSQETFTRSFKKVFGDTPGNYRRKQRQSVLFERQQITKDRLTHLKEHVTMKPEIKSKETFVVTGMEITTTLNNNKIPELWASFLPRASEIQNAKNNRVFYGVCKCNPSFLVKEFNDDTPFEEVVGLEINRDKKIPEGMVKHEVQGGLYAVFTHKGKLENLRTTYDYIWGTWVPNSGYEIDLRDDFEVYDQRFLGPDNESSEMDIYIPIKSSMNGI